MEANEYIRRCRGLTMKLRYRESVDNKEIHDLKQRSQVLLYTLHLFGDRQALVEVETALIQLTQAQRHAQDVAEAEAVFRELDWAEAAE